MNKYMSAVLGITRAYQIRFYRDKVAMFFTILFPLIFLFIFGTIFGSNSNPSFKVALLNESESQFATQFVDEMKKGETFNVQEDITEIEDAKERMSRGEVDSIIVLPESFGQPGADQKPAGEMEVYYQQGSEQTGRTVAAVMEQILAEINTELGQSPPFFTVKQTSTGDSGLSQFDYTFAGLLGFTILGTTIFGLANSMPAEKQRGSFRRMRAAPFKPSQLILGNSLHYLITTGISIVIMVLVGILVFDFQMRGSWLIFAAFAALSTLMMIGFGLLIGGWAKNENQAAPASNLLSFPLMFLSGIFFPRFLFPEWLQNVTAYVPLTPVVDGFRRIMTENASLIDLGPELAIISVWGIVIYLLTIKVFRWE
jgi:ABC-2 type transport system permease protein